MNERREGLPPRMQGVFTAASFSELLPQHRKIIARVVNEVIRLGIAEFEVERALRGESRDEAHPTRSYLANVYGRQPHQSFLIDGQKGSGKTTLLLNLHRALAQIGPTGCGRHDRSSFPINQLETYASFRGHKLDDFNSCRIAGISRCLVQPLPLIRPDSMEKHETIMESVFAEMTHQLDAEINAVTRTYHDSEFADVPAPRARWSQGTERRAERAKKLRHTLQAEVAKGWYFARALGVEALLSDSMNFDEYIERRAEEAVVSHRRLTNWSSFVIDYLDLFESQMLAIFIDDTDISAELAADILHTIRMYFCHPRIAVLMAGNLHTIRQRLLVRAMGQQAASHESLRTPDSFTARFWRDFERENLEEYLSKVLPRPYRHFIPASSAIPFLAPDAKGTSAKLASSSGEQAPPPQSFVDFCGKQMSKRIASYLRERRTTLQRSQDDARLRWSRYESLVKLANKKNSYHR